MKISNIQNVGFNSNVALDCNCGKKSRRVQFLGSYPVQFGASSPIGDTQNQVCAPNQRNKIRTFAAYKPVIKEGLRELDKKEMILIMHGSSFPSLPGEDTGYGNMNSAGAKELIDFISGVFTGIQLGPNGKTKSSDPSPYTCTLFSSNPLFIDLKQLTEDSWGNILPEKDFNATVAGNKKAGKAETNYSYIYEAQDKALRKAYEKFTAGNSPKIKELKQEFEAYKNAPENDPWLENDALYEALSKKHDMDYWPNWDDELDRNLLQKQNTKKGQERLAEIKSDYADEIDFYKFEQFVFSKQIQETKKYANSKGVKLIADKQVALSDRDVWAYRDLFLDGIKLGCPPDYFSENGQTWGFSVLDPDKMFNKDGSLGEAGELLKKSFTKMFKEYGTLRIDHFLGIVDPWVYHENAGNTKASDGGARLYSSPFNPEFKKYSIITEENINRHIDRSRPNWSESNYIDPSTLTDEQVKRYSMYAEKIILDAARDTIPNGARKAAELEKTIATSKDPKEVHKAELKLQEMNEGLKNSLIAEDLGAMTAPAEIVMDRLNLNGIKVVQFMNPNNPNDAYAPQNIGKDGKTPWYMIGSHDNPPLSVWAQNIVKDANRKGGDRDEGTLNWKQKRAEDMINYITNYLYAHNSRREEYRQKMHDDPKFLMQSVYALLMKSPAQNVQIFFSDLFGDERMYNIPGTTDGNWQTRAQNNFKYQYNTALNNDMALNFPKCLKTAIQSRLEDK